MAENLTAVPFLAQAGEIKTVFSWKRFVIVLSPDTYNSDLVVGISTIRPLGEKCQVVIPKNIRDTFNLKPGVNLEFNIEDGKIVISPQYPDTFLSDFCSIVKHKIREPINFKDIIDREIVERMNHDLS